MEDLYKVESEFCKSNNNKNLLHLLNNERINLNTYINKI